MAHGGKRPREGHSRLWIPQKIYVSGFVCPFGERRSHQPRPAASAAVKREATFKDMQQERETGNKNQKSPVRIRYCFPEHARIPCPNACELVLSPSPDHVSQVLLLPTVMAGKAINGE